MELTLIQEKPIKCIPDIRLTKLRRHNFRDIFNAVLYVEKTGVQWRLLSPHFPKWKTLYHHFRSFTIPIALNVWKLPLPGAFPANFVHLSGHNARIAPSVMNEIVSKIRRPDINIFCGKGS